MQDDRLSRILNEEVPRDSLLGDEFECAVLEVLVGDAAVVQERDVRVGGPDFLHQRKGQCREPQHAESASMGPASRIANHGLIGSAVREPEGAETGRILNIADDAGKQGRSGLVFFPGAGKGPNDAWFQPRLRSKYPAAANRKLAAETFQNTPIQVRQALGSKGVILLILRRVVPSPRLGTIVAR